MEEMWGLGGRSVKITRKTYMFFLCGDDMMDTCRLEGSAPHNGTNSRQNVLSSRFLGWPLSSYLQIFFFCVV